MELVKIKMTDSGPNNNYIPGSLVEVDEARAAAMVAGGHAEYLDENKVDKPRRRRAGG